MADMFYYETHVHTSPVSACAKVSVEEMLKAYKKAGYAGVFMTDHFIDGNLNLEARVKPYEERIEYYFSAYEEGKAIGDEIGIDVFLGIEMSYGGTDFLVYGIDKEWCLAHPDMHKMRKSELLKLMMDDGALIIQAHPFREAAYIDHIRLFPRQIHGVEVFNANRNDFENKLAEQYAENYNLIRFAGSDNHTGKNQKLLGGIATERPIESVQDFIEMVFSGEARPFKNNGGEISLI